MPKYINPYTDFGFKKLFGEEANKDLLIDFLNELLPPHHKIQDLSFKNNEQAPDLPVERRAIFDIHCQAVNGERFLVEMQKAKINFFKDRSLFYVTFPVREQAKRGSWNFELRPIYFIAILDFEYDEKEERKKFLRHVQLKDQDCEVFYDKLHFKFIQMPLFTKEEHELETHFDKWIYFLKKLETFDEIPAILKEPIFEKAFRVAEVANLPPDERDEYEFSRISYLELVTLKNETQARLEAAEAQAQKAEAQAQKAEAQAQKAEAQAQKAEAQAQKAEAQAQKAEAQAQAAELEGRKKVAQNMKQEGLDSTTIQRLTGLSEDEINNL